MSTEAAKKFSLDWNGRGNEISDTQKFWLALLRDVLDVDQPENIIDFQKPIKIDGQTKWIDGYIARTKVLIEQKSFGEDLDKKFHQSDDEYLTPFEQGKRYADNMVDSERPRWIITCNFGEFNIFDLVEMNSLEYRFGGEIYRPFNFKLAEIHFMCRRLKFLVDPNVTEFKPEVQISKAAANIVKIIYDDFKKSYKRKNVEGYKNFLDKLCTRLVFCFYAGHAQILDDKFFKYLSKFEAEQRLNALQKIFDVLNTPKEKRPENLDEDLKSFPYINGGLFAEKIPLPEYSKFDGDPTRSINAADNPDNFNWRKIDPTIFGALFESILNEEERRTGGMHYTMPENIHKVIDPLFMDDLREEFIAAKHKQLKNRPQAFFDLQNKIAALTFLDPACGSGNFLTETYMSLRRLENEILGELRALKVPLPENPVKVSINQFFGIEINDFAVAVAQTALWIAENQMLQETEGEIGKPLEAFPIKNYPEVVCKNANQVDWQKIFGEHAPEKFDYIIGNPPFRGARNKSKQQKDDIKKVFGKRDNLGNLDYVTCWYKKAADFIGGTGTRCAFVSTNSICQGDSIGALWKNLFGEGIHIDFAHRTFKWLSDSDNPAHVHCVVVGFSKAPNSKQKIIFDGEEIIEAENINAYLIDGENVFVESRDEPLCDVPEINFGSMPNDGGNLIIEYDYLDYFLKHEPAAADYIRSYIGAKEFINGLQRKCLWLEDVSSETIESMPLIAERVEACRQYRLKSKRAATRKLATTPTLFAENRQPTTNYLLVPITSSERRRYIPMGFLPPNVIGNSQAQLIPDAQIYHFGVLTSSIHMAWMRNVAGRLKSDYRYTAQIVYNNFPWPKVDERQRKLIERAAQEILDVRKDFSDWTFAKLYNEDTMPPELRWAHNANDYAVALAYGFEKFYQDEPKVVAALMKLYKRLTN